MSWLKNCLKIRFSFKYVPNNVNDWTKINGAFVHDNESENQSGVFTF